MKFIKKSLNNIMFPIVIEKIVLMFLSIFFNIFFKMANFSKSVNCVFHRI